MSGWLSRTITAATRHPLARLGDAMTLAFVVYFHRVIGAKFHFAPYCFDERYFVFEGWSAAKGLVPYRDIQEFKPPMIIVINALGIRLFGLEGMGFRWMFTLVSLTAFVCLTVALLTRQVSRILVAGAMALLINHFFDGGLHDASINDSETIGLNCFLIGSALLLAKAPWKRARQVLGGAVLALSPLSKEPFAFPTLAAWLTLLALEHFEAKEDHAAKRFAIFTVSGVFGVLGVWLTYMLATRSLGWYIVQLKLTIAYSKNYAYQLNLFPKDPTEGELHELWRRLREGYVNPARVGVFVPFYVAAVTLWRGRRALIGLLALASALGGLYAVTIGRAFFAHYFIMAMAGSFFLVLIGMIALDQQARAAGPRIRRWVGLVTIAVAYLTLWQRFTDERAKYRTYTMGDVPVSKPHLAYVIAHSMPEDRIWTMGEPLLYVYSGRLNAVREPIVLDELIDYYPGATDAERLAGEHAELVRNPPKIVIFGDDPSGYTRKQRYIAALVTPFLAEMKYRKIDAGTYERPD